MNQRIIQQGLSCVREGWRHYWSRVVEANLLQSAASLSYATLLTLVPFLIVVIAILAPFHAFQGVGLTLQQFILSNFMTDLASQVNAQITEFVSHVNLLTTTSIVVLAVFIVFMMFNIAVAFNTIWRVRLRYHFAVHFLIYTVYLVVAPLLFGLLLFLGPYLTSLQWLVGAGLYDRMANSLLWLFPHFSAWCVFTLFHWLLPDARVPFRNAVIAGAVTALLFAFAKMGFAYYLQLFTLYQLIYGALAAIPFFLIWMYVTWLVILLGVVCCVN